ncbi:MAG: phosphate signaling complex protein PhoU [Deltaproteobacteria bacterium]|nr:MAG: phosphate signaling complex protein PhoU [Deltaproteobacteria bacterium]
MHRTHTDREYEAKLEDLRRRLIVMAERVDEMVEASVRAVVARDAALARTVIDRDADVDRWELECDELCLLVLARWQPMASDLRFITIALKMVTDLERIGDLAVNIAERAQRLAEMVPLEYATIPRMGEAVRKMLGDAVSAFVIGDAELARAVLRADDAVDEDYHQVFRALMQLMQSDPALIDRGIQVQSVAKFLERIGDHATNLAEQAIFMVAGKDVRHLHGG